MTGEPIVAVCRMHHHESETSEFLVRIDAIQSMTLSWDGAVGMVETSVQTPITRESYDELRAMWLDHCRVRGLADQPRRVASAAEIGFPYWLKETT